MTPSPPPRPPVARLLGRRRHTIRIGAHERTAKVSFRFAASGIATAFRCKLDRRPLKSCRSPKSYRVGVGKHVFRVRAVGPTGIGGPAASFHFSVARR